MNSNLLTHCLSLLSFLSPLSSNSKLWPWHTSFMSLSPSLSGSWNFKCVSVCLNCFSLILFREIFLISQTPSVVYQNILNLSPMWHYNQSVSFMFLFVCFVCLLLHTWCLVQILTHKLMVNEWMKELLLVAKADLKGNKIKSDS